MREWIPIQAIFGQTSIERLELNPKSRDDIPALLMGLKTLYMNEELRMRILSLLGECIGKDVSLEYGRPGMDLWRILVLGVLRLGAELDYDRLHELANEHNSVRVMLKADVWKDEKWTLETIKDNVSLLTPEVLGEVSQVVVQAGHQLLKKNGEEERELKGRCDSFVVKTDVHYPTDVSLLLDALRVLIRMMIRLSRFDPITGWRQGHHLYKKLKKLVRAIGRMKKLIRDSKGRESKDPKRAEQKRKELERKEQEVLGLHREILKLAQGIVNRAVADLKVCQPHPNKEKAEEFLVHAERQIDQIRRRVLQGEKIPQEEKVYSVFEPHTEWICKGKAGVPQELGVMVSILEDQHGFVLHHQLMRKQADVDVAVPIVREAKSRFPNLKSCSFDKGYHSPENKAELGEILDEVILPKKGKLNEAQLREETSEPFVNARNAHSAVESGINCLEHHGLSRCLDHGIDGFERYVALAVLSKNIYLLGRLIIARDQKRRKRARALALETAA